MGAKKSTQEMQNGTKLTKYDKNDQIKIPKLTQKLTKVTKNDIKLTKMTSN